MIDHAAALALPGAADEASYAVAGDWPALVPADRKHEMAGSQRCGVAALSHREPVRREAQHRDVGAGIAAAEGGGDAPPIRQGDGDVVLALQRLLGGDKDARPPMDGAGRTAPAA